MNMLSRNISIDQSTFEKLVTQSVADTIQLLLAPYVFYEQEIQKLAQNGTTIRINEEFKPALKYVKTHKILFDQIVKGLEEKSDAGMISVTKAIDTIGTIVDNNVEYDDPKMVLRQLGDIVPLKIQEFVTFTDQTQQAQKVEEKVEEKKPEPVVVPTPQKEDAKSFFETSFEEEDNEKMTNFAPSEITYLEKKEEPKIEKTRQENAPLFKSYKREEVAEEKSSYSVPHFMNEDKKKGNPVTATSTAPKQAETLEATTFADKYTTGADVDTPTFAERFQPSGKTIKELITLNQKFLFTKKLFGNNQEELEEALTGIDRCASHKEAIMFLKNNYIMKYDWNLQHDEVKEFWELVELRF